MLKVYHRLNGIAAAVTIDEFPDEYRVVLSGEWTEVHDKPLDVIGNRPIASYKTECVLKVIHEKSKGGNEDESSHKRVNGDFSG